MTDPKTKPCRPISATELMEQLQNDQEYQPKVQAAEGERQVRAQELRRAEQPIVADVRNAGVQVKSVWDLVNRSEPHPAALPVLIEHLTRGGYPVGCRRAWAWPSRSAAVRRPLLLVSWERLNFRRLSDMDDLLSDQESLSKISGTPQFCSSGVTCLPS